ncbi:UxaA family hydrolase [uncultured Parasutterella sp.]|uniref:UxaA family hydrolase n=1 Tax=uncultured Parasutterella sp. TaxID=1263098 RepID=UPI00259304E6|nr:UxaA family hydrolase [uncultured Parasutterella sp.]
MEFLGYKRSDGSVGVRNHVLILPSCACASETCRVVASQVRGTKNVIINVGCSDVAANTELTQRVLTGFALNANVYGVIIIGLGCETVGHRQLADKIRALTDKPVVSFGIQEEGGTVGTAALAVRAARQMVAEASQMQRTKCPVSDLFVAIECGGSDATSGIASNPAVGNMADRLVDLGATTMMSETVEFIGAEHVLARRGATPEIHDQIIRICEDYEKHLALAGQDCRTGQPTPGNKAGGLSTIEEKSLGCIHKGGTRPVVEVLAEAARSTKKGALIMDTPGYDISSVTSMIAGGATVVVFTSGRGTPTGHALAPVIKVTANPITAKRMKDNMDIDVSGILEGEETINEAGERILEDVVEVASGKMTKAEALGFSDIAVDHVCRFI